MIKVIEVMLSSVQGTILFGIFGVSILAMVAYLIVKLPKVIKNLKFGKDGVSFEGHSGVEGQVGTIRIKYDDQSISILFKAIEGAITSYDNIMANAVAIAKREYRTSRENCVKEALDWIFTGYSQREDKPEGKDEIFRYFIEVEFADLLTEELLKIKDNMDVSSMGDEDRDYTINRIVDQLSNNMLNKVTRIDLVNRKVMTEIFNEKRQSIRDSILRTIKEFCKSSKKEQEEKIRATEVRATEIRTRLEEQMKEM